MAKRIAVVVSQGQSQNPQKRQLEEDLITKLMFEAGLDVTVVPHLYDLKPDGTGMLALQGIKGDVVVCSWMFERAAHWVLDRNGIHGHVGTTLIRPENEEEDEEELEEALEAEKSRVIETREVPNRRIYCLDLRVHGSSQPYVDEIQRIAREATVQTVGLGQWLGGSPSAEQLQRYVEPQNDAPLPLGGAGELAPDANSSVGDSGSGDTADGAGGDAGHVVRVEETTGRRWYPVIDYSRCTNCMECIDFCLFGVYGVDTVEQILVEQPDNCRKGCPACSRVCPENAIIFPQHKTPAIAGAEELAASLKIDLSKLFGAPEGEADALEIAVKERDEQLVMAGRDAVGEAVGLPKRQENRESEEQDDLDDLIDQLDDLDL